MARIPRRPLIAVPVPSVLTRTATRLVAWPSESQQVARRNAMVASNVLLRRRQERQDVEEFLAGFFGARYLVSDASQPSLSDVAGDSRAQG